MAQVVLIHSALGLTSHVLDWADALRVDGHVVTTPDLFDGDVYDNLDDGVARVDSVGMDAFVPVAAAQTAHLTGPLVYAGFSLGGAVAEVLALMQPEAKAAVIMHGAVSPAWFNITEWPAGLRAQLHYAADDPWVEADENAAFMALAAGKCEEFVYPGDGHLFAFEDWQEYDADAAETMFERVTDFLAEIDNDE